MLELVVVHPLRSMVARWGYRWESNVTRYVNLNCVKLIKPWSGPGRQRFCTSEEKVAPISQYLKRRFAGRTIISATGIRREESNDRRNAKVFKEDDKLLRKPVRRNGQIIPGTAGYSWNPLVDWTRRDVFSYLSEKRFALHEAYTIYGSSRLSCSFCVLASLGDLRAAATCEDNQAVYLKLVDLESRSAFSFQANRWLADVAPHILTSEQRERSDRARTVFARRNEVEGLIPEHLLYTKGWPRVIPTESEARLLCEVRREVSRLQGFSSLYTEPQTLISRYRELYEISTTKRGPTCI